MPNVGMLWKQDEVERLQEAWKNKVPGTTLADFARSYSKAIGRSVHSVRGKVNEIDAGDAKPFVQPSPYPVYNKPLTMEGDALVLPDLELPFHHAEFVNRALDLAQKWGIRQLILGGDFLHFDALSGFDRNWVEPKHGGITEDAERRLNERISKLPAKYQAELREEVASIGRSEEQDGLSTEMEVARREMLRITSLFDLIHLVVGNHEGRPLRILETTVSPKLLLGFMNIESPKIMIAPYYFSYLDTDAGRFHIEHPKNSAKFSASALVSKYLCHVLMGHSHQLNYTFDRSGCFYAIEMGCCVDEARLPYAAQRHNTSPAHALGAVIVRGGHPWLLHDRVDWSALAKM